MSTEMRMAARTAWLTLSAWLAPATGEAQLPDLVEVNAQYLPGAALEDPRPTEAQVASYDASLNLPLVLGERTFLIPGVGYHADAVSYSRTPPAFTELRAFHSIEVPVLFVQLLSNDWSLSVRVAPGVAADAPEADTGLLRLSALALMTHGFSDRLVLGGGGIGSFSFGSFLPLPAAYVEWKPSDAFRVETFLPAFVDARCTFWDRLELGVRADVTGNAYAVRDERITGAWPCVPAETDDPSTAEDETRAQPSQCLDHVAYSTGTAGVVVGVRVAGSVWWTAMAGHSFFRRFEQLNDHDERVAGGLQSIPDVPFFRTGITWRIPRD